MLPLLKTALFPLQATVWASTTFLYGAGWAAKWAWKSIRGQPKGKTGDAYFSDLKELRKLGHTRHTGGFYVGKMFRSDIYGGRWLAGEEQIYTHPEQSVVMVGQSGAGKSQSVIADQRAIRRCAEPLKPDFICIDPVGEIEFAAADSLLAQGYQVLRIDLNHPERGLQYIPLWFQPGMPGYDYQLALFGNSVIPPPVRNPEDEKHFPKGARAALMAMIAWQQVNNKHGCTLQSCMEKLVAKQTTLAELITLMRQSPSAMVRNNIGFLEIISPKEYGSFASTMAGYFAPYLFDNVLATCKTRADADGVVLEPVDLLKIFRGNQKTAIYIRTGNHGAETGAFVRMILSNAVNIKRWLLNQWNEGKDYHKAPGLQRMFKLYTDETKNLGNATALTVMQDELRKARCRGFYPFLTDADIFNTFSGAKNMVSGAVQILAGANNDYETLENRSRILGEETIQTTGESYSRGGKSQSYHDQFRRLYTPDKVRKIPGNKRLVIMGQVQFIPYNTWQFKKGKAIY